jgi:cytochrome c peroxidase
MGADFDWNLPKVSHVTVELGRYLFYDQRMSMSGKESCGSCHRQELAFTDGRARAEGTTGQLHPRSSRSLVAVAYDMANSYLPQARNRLSFGLSTRNRWGPCASAKAFQNWPIDNDDAVEL